METIQVTRFVAEGLMEQFSRVKEVFTDLDTCNAEGIYGSVEPENIDVQLLFSYVTGQYGDSPTQDDEQEASDQIKEFMAEVSKQNSVPFIAEWVA